jgi:hypothetical protein
VTYNAREMRAPDITFILRSDGLAFEGLAKKCRAGCVKRDGKGFKPRQGCCSVQERSSLGVGQYERLWGVTNAAVSLEFFLKITGLLCVSNGIE